MHTLCHDKQAVYSYRMKKLSQKWCVVALLQPVPEGAEFDWREWPLHVTIAPTFAIDRNSEEISSLLSKTLQGQSPVSLQAIEELEWAVKVMRLESTSEISTLHLKITEVLKESGAVFNEPQYIGKNFIPHVTAQKSGLVEVEDKITLDSFSLIDMFPNSDGLRRKVVKTFSLLG